ncbi:Listeria/Bacterioides repeat-containing protein, partial [Anaerosphaera aminiphila DSM 21120]
MEFKNKKPLTIMLMVLAMIIGTNQIAPSIVVASEGIEIIELHEIIPVNTDEDPDVKFGVVEDIEELTETFKSEVENIFEESDLIPDYIGTFLNEDLNKAKDDRIQQILKYESKDKILSDDIESFMNEIYSMQYDLYNNFKKAYNKYISDDNYEEDIASEILNSYAIYQRDMFYKDTDVSYSALGEKQEVSETTYLEEAYDEIYERLSEKITDKNLLKEETYKLIKNALYDWIKETSIDYIKGYIAQVNQYLNLAKEFGYAYDEEEGEIYNIYSEHKPVKYRELELGDIENTHLFELDEDFLKLSINDRGNEFLTPEEIWNSGEFQEIVNGVISDLEDNEDISKEKIVDLAKATIDLQYEKVLMAIGSSQQPTVEALPEFLEVAINEMSNYGKNELPEISSWQTEDGKLPYDIYRKENYIKVPYVIFTKYIVTYDNNAPNTTGKIPIDENKYDEDDNVTILSNGDLARAGYTFKGWNTKADGSGISYNPGDTFKITANTTLYAQWEKDSEDSGTGWTWGGGSSTTSKEKPKTEVEETLTHMAYLNGYPDNTIRPQGSITRAEVAAIFARLKVGEANIPSAKANYSDVNSSDWYTKYIAFVTDNKIMEGYEDGSFKPNDKITRAEFTAVVARYNSLADMTSTFEDVIGRWAAGYIGSVTNKGWINGYPDGTFKPEKDISREEVATMVNKML